jgi:hypothetical protein
MSLHIIGPRWNEMLPNGKKQILQGLKFESEVYFCKYSFLDAREYAGSNGLVATLPMLGGKYYHHLQPDSPHPPGLRTWRWAGAHSEDISGSVNYTNQEYGLKKGDNVVITLHNGRTAGGFMSPGITLPAVLKMGPSFGSQDERCSHTGALSLDKFYDENVINLLLEDGILAFDGTPVPLFSFEDAKHNNVPGCFDAYAIVRSLELAQQTISGRHEFHMDSTSEGLETIADGKKVIDPQVITYLGGQNNADMFFDDFLSDTAKTHEKLMQGFTELGVEPPDYLTNWFEVYHLFNEPDFEPDVCQGRILSMGGSASDRGHYAGLRGDIHAHAWGGFIGAKPVMELKTEKNE